MTGIRILHVMRFRILHVKRIDLVQGRRTPQLTVEGDGGADMDIQGGLSTNGDK